MMGIGGNGMDDRSNVRELEIHMEVTSLYDNLLSVDKILKESVVQDNKLVDKKLKEKPGVIRVGKEDKDKKNGPTK